MLDVAESVCRDRLSPKYRILHHTVHCSKSSGSKFVGSGVKIRLLKILSVTQNRRRSCSLAGRGICGRAKDGMHPCSLYKEKIALAHSPLLP